MVTLPGRNRNCPVDECGLPEVAEIQMGCFESRHFWNLEKMCSDRRSENRFSASSVYGREGSCVDRNCPCRPPYYIYVQSSARTIAIGRAAVSTGVEAVGKAAVSTGVMRWTVGGRIVGSGIASVSTTFGLRYHG